MRNAVQMRSLPQFFSDIPAAFMDGVIVSPLSGGEINTIDLKEGYSHAKPRRREEIHLFRLPPQHPYPPHY